VAATASQILSFETSRQRIVATPQDKNWLSYISFEWNVKWCHNCLCQSIIDTVLSKNKETPTNWSTLARGPRIPLTGTFANISKTSHTNPASVESALYFQDF